ncbi:MAG: enoyl-CoA hydratase/isomerase family protein [Ilumatobacteraceae bacterium]
MSDHVLDVERHGHVEVLRINRPQRLNAISSHVIFALTAEVKRIRRDDGVRAFIITGAPRADGRPCFSAGDDLQEATAGGLPKGNPGGTLIKLIDECMKPSIAVVDGVCTTGAIELALACDLRVVADTAQISDWHLARLGSGLGGWGASTRLSRLVGVAQAKDVILTGKVIDGAEALRIGFAQRMVPSADLWAEAMSMADAIAKMDPAGVHITMAHLSRVEDLSKEEALTFATQLREWFTPNTTFEDRAAGVLDANRGVQPQ